VASLSRKVGNNYRPMFPLPRFKWCDMVSGKHVKIGPVIKLIMTTLKPHVPSLFKECPYIGRVVFLLRWRIVVITVMVMMTTLFLLNY
jgi:hypothetical protein